MSAVKLLLDKLLWDIYGKQRDQSERRRKSRSTTGRASVIAAEDGETDLHRDAASLRLMSVWKLIDISAILKVEIHLIGHVLERALIHRDKSRRRQDVLCAFVEAILRVECDDAHSRMRFSLSPPPPKVPAAVTSPSGTSSVHTSGIFDLSAYQASADSVNGGYDGCSGNRTDGMSAATGSAMIDDVTSDYSQWLHAMKLVARLPGGMPPEFRRKLWLSLADKYLKSKNVDWSKAEEKCFCEKWREDDEELGVQIVKDLHRTGSNICTGPAGSINQAKLKRILLGYARYNPEVGYCQGFNMLGALILQVMDKEEDESMKVMIYLVEGVLPTGYFCGSMGGLQADMGVFRELMQTTQPRLAKHLQKLQGPVENAYEPPLTNVFTMQWFLTMFCTCLPMTCVLRVWDLVLIEGSDVLLRTALVLWSLLEERVLNSRTADDFYCKMGSFSSELLNGHLIDSNGLIEKVVLLGPIPDIQKLRDKHLYNIAPLRSTQGLQLYFDDEEMESDEESRLAVATVWGIPWGRRGSHGQPTVTKQTSENKDRIALDISLLKKQYDRLRERQKQAHIILTSACSTPRQGNTPAANTFNQQSVPVNQLLLGRSAIITNKGKRIGPLPGAIPPARKPSLPTVLQTKPPEKQLRRGETLHWRDTDLSKRRRDSLTWKEIKADRATMLSEAVMVVPAQKLRSRVGKSDSSSYSEEDSGDNDDCSSTDTSLCDEDDPISMGDKTHSTSIESSPKKRSKVSRKLKDVTKRKQTLSASHDSCKERKRPNSWAPSSEIPFILMTSDSPLHNEDEKYIEQIADAPMKDEEDSTTECDRLSCSGGKKLDTEFAHTSGNLNEFKVNDLHSQTTNVKVSAAISTSQQSLLPDISPYLSNATISSLPSSKPLLLASMSSLGSEDGDGDETKKFDVSDDGVTNEYFERVNSVERPTKLELFFSLNEEDSARNASEGSGKDPSGDDSKIAILISSSNVDVGDQISNADHIRDNTTQQELPGIITLTNVNRCMELLIDYSEKSSAAFIAQATNELSISLNKEKNPPDFQKVKCLMRDANIPGEICNEFNENTQAFRSKRFVEHNMLSSENNIRKNSGQVTVSRSSTIENEKGVELIQTQLSGDVIGNEVKNSKPSSEEVPEISDSSNGNGKIIPSTADLEKRFNTLERQQSLSVHRNSTAYGHSVNETECTTSKPNETNTHINSNRNQIPSTADLESRFDALERQMSSSNAAAITSVGRKDNEGDADSKSKSNKTTSGEVTQSPLDSKESESDTEIKIIELSSGPSVNRDRQPLKKLPSAAELEDRFNALERKKSLQNITPFQTKKEPPDVKKKQGTNHKEVEKINRNLKSTQNNTDNSNSSEAEIVLQNTESQMKDEKHRKKAPPSTEELEKRFNALEKHMNQQSSPINESDVKNQSTSLNPPKFQNSLQTTQKTSVPSNEKLSDKADNAIETTAQNKTHYLGNFKTKDSEKKKIVLTERDNLSKRRSSEPPLTEDLETRYESLKRRMSSKIINEKCMSKSETVEEALERIEKVIIDDISEVNERLKTKESSLENTSEKPHSNFRTNDSKEIPGEEKSAQNVLLTELSQESCEKKDKCREKNKTELHSSWIPDPPPIPLVIAAQAKKANGTINLTTHRALIEELQTKIRVQANDENLKPSDMILSRKRLQLQRTALTGDETSETHADTAFNRSENYEPLQYRIQSSKKMMAVRRFSDLPSRADLENRLYFLETQFSTRIYKQRCASDSEVASRMHFSGIDRDEDKPTTSLPHESSSEQLERRVLALEKQLSDNSLKLLQALNKKEPEIPNPNEYPQILSSETIDASGRELVRYANIDDVEENETHKPINISINIKMLMSKDLQKVKTEIAAACLEKRVEDIEKQLDASKVKESVNKSKNDALNINRSQIDTTKEANCANDNQADVLNVLETTNEISTDIYDHKNEQKNQDIEKVNATNEETLNNEVIVQHSKKEEETIPEAISAHELSEKTENAEHHPSFQDTEVEHEKSHKSLNAAVGEQTQPFTSTEQHFTSEELAQKYINESDIECADPKNKTLVLLLDNEPKSVKVRRLTRANTEELEGLFQALEKQLSDRNLIKSEDGKLTHCDKQEYTENEKSTEESKAIVHLTEEITKLASADVEIKPKDSKDFDWGPDPIKRHLKRKTVHLPSTKELESRFRSLERQIKLLEDVENIDVEQRLNEIERKIKLQHSLSHEKDLVKFLELCEEQDLDNNAQISLSQSQNKQAESIQNTPARNKRQSPYTSPSRTKAKSPYASPTRSIIRKSPYTSPSRSNKRCQQSSPHRRMNSEDIIPSTEDLEYRYRSLDLSRSKSKESLSKYSRKKSEASNKPIHPLEMLLDPSSDDDDIPTTGELEHRMKVLEENRKQHSHQRKSRSHSPIKRELPTTDELEARVRALEKEQCFDIKMQNNFKEFNQKLKDVVSPSQSFDEFQPSILLEESLRHCDISRSITPRSTLRDLDVDISQGRYRSTSPKMIRFRDNEEYSPQSKVEHRDTERTVGNAERVLKTIEENSEMLHRILKKTLTDSNNIIYGSSTALSEGLDALGTRFMRETSPLQRTGTHTGVPLRTNDNINERLTSIKNTIKSIDSLCEEKPYRKEKCQRYIDSLFSDSVHFAHKKTSLENLKKESHTLYGYTPSICVSDHTQRPSEYLLSRSTGSVESMHSTSPLRAASPLHHRSNRDLRRDTSPRWRRDEEREEYESRVRRDNILPKSFPYDISKLSRNSLTKFHEVDRQQETHRYDERERSSSSRSGSRSPMRSPYGSRETMMLHNTTANTVTTEHNRRLDMDRPSSPYRQTSHNLLGHDPLKRSNTPIYSPSKLDIRHTTVTSTFYDRLLTEKQIEKTFSRPSSRSPIISPSVTSKSYLDILIPNGSNNSQMSKENSPTITYMKCIRGATNLQPSVYSKSFGFSNNADSTEKTHTEAVGNVPCATSLNSTIKTNQYSGTTSAGNSSTYQTAQLSRLPSGTDDSQTEIRIRSCDNILMEMKSISTTTAGSGSLVTATSSPTAASYVEISATTAPATITTNNPSNYISNLYNTYPIASRFSPILTSLATISPNVTTITPANTTTNTIYSVGFLNSLKPLTLQQPSVISGSLTCNTKTLDNNNSPVSMPSSSAYRPSS